MKTEKIAVSRTIEVPGQADVERKTTVAFRTAETAKDMTDLCGGDLAKVVEFYNAGRWAELRTKVSNALAGKSPEQKSVERMIAAYKGMNPALTDEQARTIVLQLPGMEAATRIVTDVLPGEIADTYFDEIKAEKAAAKKSETAPEAGK